MAGYPRKAEPIQTIGMAQVEIPVGFSPAGAGAPTAQLGVGTNKPIATLARTGVGTFLLTFDKGFKPDNLVGFGVQRIQNNAAPGLSALALGAYAFTPGDGNQATLTFYTLTSGALADLAANAATLVFFTLRFKMTPITDATGL